MILITDSDNIKLFHNTKLYFEKLANASEVIIQTGKSGIPANAVSLVTDKAQIFIPLKI